MRHSRKEEMVKLLGNLLGVALFAGLVTVAILFGGRLVAFGADQWAALEAGAGALFALSAFVVLVCTLMLVLALLHLGKATRDSNIKPLQSVAYAELLTWCREAMAAGQSQTTLPPELEANLLVYGSRQVLGHWRSLKTWDGGQDREILLGRMIDAIRSDLGLRAMESDPDKPMETSGRGDQSQNMATAAGS